MYDTISRRSFQNEFELVLSSEDSSIFFLYANIFIIEQVTTIERIIKRI